jgi:formamidopyrimidine-DNA glycosylase
MPELPEVETIVRQLAPHLPGLRIGSIEITHADLLREEPGLFRKSLTEEEFLSVTRRGKKLVFRLTGPRILVVNLGMTGQLLFLPSPESTPPPRHRALSFSLLPGGVLHYSDARRFGCLRLMTPEEWEEESDRLGPEPLGAGLTDSLFFEGTSTSRSPIRSWLLNQTRIAGIGNIYANEALFRAQVHPARQASSLDEGESARLLTSIRTVLEEAISARGTTMRDYRTAEGDRGDFGPLLRVYGRKGSPCPVCNTAVARIVFGNRSAFLCPRCQREGSSSAS